MKQFSLRLLRLIFGIFLYAVGIVVTLNANIGYAPWDVLHVGFANTVGISIGTASILAGFLTIIVAVLLGEKLGLGTIINMIFIGLFIDLIRATGIIPVVSNLAVGIVMLILGLFIIAVATYFYVGSGFGAGPRDSLMVAVTRKTKLPVGVCRGTIEVLAVFIGWRLGGMAGIGTVISALAIGFCVQLTFRFFKFDATAVQHETLGDTLRRFWPQNEQG